MNADPPTNSEAASDPSPAAPREGQANVFHRQIITLATAMLIFVLLIHLLQTFSVILQQLLVALFLVYLILPMRRWLQQQRLSAVVSYAIILLGVFLLGWILTLMVQDSFADFSNKWPQYRTNLTRMIDQLALWIPGVDPERLKQLLIDELPDVESGLEVVRRVLLTFLGVAGQVFIVVIYVAFLLAEQTSITGRIRYAFDEPRATQILEILGRINASISRYISVKTFVSLLTGLFTSTVLLLFDVDYAILWGIIAFLFNYIPYVGSVVAVTTPGLLAMIQFENGLVIGLILIFLLNGIQSIIGYWLEPVMMGERLDLSPFVIIISLAFWGSVWGIVGMILAVPLVVSFKIVLENIPDTKPIGAMLSHFRPGTKSGLRPPDEP